VTTSSPSSSRSTSDRVAPGVHLQQPVTRWGADEADAPLVVLALHGRDQDPAFMRAVAERVDLPELAWRLPAADARSWYPLSFLAPVADNEPRLSDALGAVAARRAELAAAGVGPDRLVLLGFSQGAVVLAEHLVRTADPCAGAVLLTGGHVGPPGTSRTASGDLRGTPVLLGSAEADPLVPIARVRETADLLRAMGARVELEVYDDREHLVSDVAVASTRRLLQDLLRRTPARGR
jgi:phospholipase/carboxylesterase